MPHGEECPKPVRYTCPCGAKLRIPDKQLGRQFFCPSCGVRTVVGSATSSEPPVTEAQVIQESAPPPSVRPLPPPRHSVRKSHSLLRDALLALLITGFLVTSCCVYFSFSRHPHRLPNGLSVGDQCWLSAAPGLPFFFVGRTLDDTEIGLRMLIDKRPGDDALIKEMVREGRLGMIHHNTRATILAIEGRNVEVRCLDGEAASQVFTVPAETVRAERAPPSN
jgi:hypothetical protein